MLKKYDIILILFLFIIGLLPLFLPLTGNEQLYAHITVNGETKRVIKLSPWNQHEEFTITTEKGINTILITNGMISVNSADCPDQICVKTAPISKEGEVIACLPHKLLIELNTSEK